MKCKICNKEIIPKKGHSKHPYVYCSKSCHAKDRMTTHGESNSKFYCRWTGIYRRCNDKNMIGYKNYGGRGIKCKWKNYVEFKKDMYPLFLKHCKQHGYKNTSIDRIDNDGNYCKENCKWATRKEQSENTRKTLRIKVDGVEMTINDIVEKTGFKKTTIYMRHYRGQDLFKKLRA